MRLYPAIAAAIIALAALTSCGGAPGEADARPRAAVIDQLYLMEANPELLAETTAMLEESGFAIDLLQGEDVTVDTYRQMGGAKLVILRVHSGLLMSLEGDTVAPLSTTYLFTGEHYTSTRYVADQMSDRVSNALMSEDYPLVFAVNSEFIRNESEESFEGAIVLAMGCESYYFDDMAEAFTGMGAAAYVGWSTVVSLEHTDKATLSLLDNLCRRGMTVAQAVEATMAELGRDPYFDTYLKYSPGGGDIAVAGSIK